VPAAQHAALCDQLIRSAHVADKYAKRLKKLHPVWGDGSLRAAALARGAAGQEACCGPQYQAALVSVVHALARWRGRTCARTGLHPRDLC